MQLGTPAKNSCTWPGPSQTATPQASPSASRAIWDRRRQVPTSMPFMHSTNVFCDTSYRASCAISCDRLCAPTEMQITSARIASSRPQVRRTSGPKVTRPLLRVCMNCAMCAEPSRP